MTLLEIEKYLSFHNSLPHIPARSQPFFMHYILLCPFGPCRIGIRVEILQFFYSWHISFSLKEIKFIALQKRSRMNELQCVLTSAKKRKRIGDVATQLGIWYQRIDRKPTKRNGIQKTFSFRTIVFLSIPPWWLNKRLLSWGRAKFCCAKQNHNGCISAFQREWKGERWEGEQKKLSLFSSGLATPKPTHKFKIELCILLFLADANRIIYQRLIKYVNVCT